MIKTRSVLAAAAATLMGAGVLGACAPAAPAPAPDPDPDAVTTTTDVEFACAGTGLIAPGQPNAIGPIADQTTSVAITLPSSVTEGATFDVLVDVGNLVLGAAPSFINLNTAGVVGTITTANTNGNATVAANNFVGNGASIDLNVASTTATALPGTTTIDVSDITIVAGSTGFACSPTGDGASASVTAA